jgi:hypothetical protein
MTPQKLLAVVREVAARYPEADLVKNRVGNLSVMLGVHYVGFIDLRTGELEEFRSAAILAAALTELSPDEKRELAAQLLRAANTDEGHGDE